jgi:hypothetical protein
MNQTAMNQTAASYCQETMGFDSSSSVLLARGMNDQGARLLGTGRYEEAIDMFVHALALWEQVADDGTCQCIQCSLEECIIATLPNTSPFQQCSSQHALLKGSLCQSVDKSLSCDTESEDRFIYKRPIFASPSFSQLGHSPGITLSLVIILNLAMAHHLCGIKHDYSRHQLQKALQLYELAHQVQLQEEIYSPRATMIIANNVGEIHRAVQNHNKHVLCLQHLLSTMMYMIDCRIPVRSAELEGFFRNTSQLILHNNCASAA